jgi:hypothetical protein
VIFMAYPSGKYDANVQRFLRDTNFWAAMTTASGSRHVLHDALIWDRVRISGQLRLQDFARLLGIGSAAQHTAPRPPATPTATNTPINSIDPVAPPSTPTHSYTPTARPTNIQMPATMTPSGTLPPRPTGGPPVVPTRTPFSSPLVTPTIMQSPLTTPTP